MTATDAVGYLDASTTTVPAGDEVVLPPFSGDSAVCVMCRNLEAFTRYRPTLSRPVRTEFNGEAVVRGPLPKRLERCCTRCDYTWDEALPGDASPDGGLTVDQLAQLLDACASHTGHAIDHAPSFWPAVAERLMTYAVVLAMPEQWRGLEQGA